MPWITAEAPPRHTDVGPNIGKWLVFVPAAEVDSWWCTIKIATEAGSLGPDAKVATAVPSPRAYPGKRVIVVYTFDFQDRDDVGRVLGELRSIGVDWTLSYKTDEATASGRYGPGTAIYVSFGSSLEFKECKPG